MSLILSPVNNPNCTSTAASVLRLLVRHQRRGRDSIWIDAHIYSTECRLPTFTAKFTLQCEHGRDWRLTRIFGFIAVIADRLNRVEITHLPVSVAKTPMQLKIVDAQRASAENLRFSRLRRVPVRRSQTNRREQLPRRVKMSPYVQPTFVGKK